MSSPYLRRTKEVKKLRRRGREYLYLLMGVAVLVVVMLVIAAKQNSLLSVGYRIAELRDETMMLKERQANMRAELAVLTRRDRIWKAALKQGLVPMADRNRYVVHVLDEPAEDWSSKQMVAGVGTEQ